MQLVIRTFGDIKVGNRASSARTLPTERFIANRTVGQEKTMHLVNRPFRLHPAS